MQHTSTHAGAIKLRTALPRAKFFGTSDVPVASCTSDARSCRPGDLFVALVTAEGDGHDDVFMAIENGATSILSERLLPVDVPVCVVDDTREAYGHVCHQLMGRPSENMHVIGVTGTAGKTITNVLISSVLEAAGMRAGFATTLGRFDGLETASATQTTPPQHQLADQLARMASNYCSHAVLEVSSKALAQRHTAGIQFDSAVLTNVRRDHLDFHGSVKNYRNAKLRLFEQLKPDGFAIINADDPTSDFFLDRIDHPTLTVGMRNQAEITATVVEQFKSEQTFLLTAGSESVPIRTQMIGDHHVYNCMAAAAVGLVLGIDLTTIARGLEAVDQVPGRLERIECGQPFGVFIDSARTPHSLACSLKALRQVTKGKLTCIFGADADRDPDNRPLLGRAVERYADRGIITSDNPRNETALHIAHDILDGYDRPARGHVMPDRAKAIEWALGQAGPGDTVLIAGKGNETFQIVGNQRLQFDDREVARSWLYDVGAAIEYEQTARPVLKIARPIA